ncbi:MAG: DUF4118 domain-containing protein [Chloroflexi bacterium]|nr:DUF4118 domain-containing protein [Chloroflexota bacterium]
MTRLAPYVWALASITVVSALIALVSADTRIANVSILYLPAVLLTAARAGRGPAIVASVAAFLAYDVLFIEPRFHLAVAEAEEWLALLLLLLAAVITGQVAADQRVRARAAERREREAILLYDVTRLMGHPDLDAALADVAERVRRELGLAGVAIDIEEGVHVASGDEEAREALRTLAASRVIGAGRSPTGAEAGGPVRGVRVVSPYLRRVAAPGPSSIPINVEGRRVGTLRALGRARGPSREEDRTLAAVAAQIGGAFERERLRGEAAESEILRRADEAKRALLHAVSHDLRTPLSSIIASATSLRQRDVTWSDEEREEFVAGIEGEARRLDRFVGDLLSVSRIEAGTLSTAKDWHDVGALVEDVARRFRSVAPRHRIVTEVSEGLAPAKLDQVQMTQVLTNLLENATKYAPAGSEIVLRARDDGADVRMEVLDRGPGVPVAATARIFEPFERVAREGTPAGTGLGLAVARSFVEAHGGHIWVEPRPGGGSTFAFTLPRSP